MGIAHKSVIGKLMHIWRSTNGGRSDGRYIFFVCTLNLVAEPLSAEERRITGGKYKVVAKEVLKPFSSSLFTRESGGVEKASSTSNY